MIVFNIWWYFLKCIILKIYFLKVGKVFRFLLEYIFSKDREILVVLVFIDFVLNKIEKYFKNEFKI